MALGSFLFLKEQIKDIIIIIIVVESFFDPLICSP
jgi:hypothetical protein